MLTYTTIQHEFRKSHKLNYNEYVLLDMIYFLQTNPSSKVKGWCYSKKKTLAEEIGITRQGLNKLIASLCEKGFLVEDEKTRHLQTTDKWNVVYFQDQKRKLSLHENVNSVDTKGKLSLHPSNKDIDNTNKPSESDQSLFAVLKETYLNWYQDCFETSYYFSASDGKSLSDLIKKFTSTGKSKNIAPDKLDSYVKQAFRYFLENLPEFDKKNNSLKLLSSRYNQIISNIVSARASEKKPETFQRASVDYSKLIHEQQQRK